MQSYSDRSRSVEYRKCPRSFWFKYCHPTKGEVPGVVPEKLNIDLTQGLTFHEGVNHLLTGAGVDEAVGRALEGHGDWMGYWPLVKSRGLFLAENEDASYVYHEQAALAEALIRGYAMVMLPQLLERFEIVEAEKDEQAVFTLGDFELVWGGRTDALLMDKDTLDLEILSLKTKKEWKGIRDDKVNRYDMQGMSETAMVEQRLERWHKILDAAGNNPVHENIPDWFRHRHKTGASPNVLGVKMEYALKGRRSEWPSGSGRWTYSNPLIRPWKKDDGLSMIQWATQYEFKDEMGGNHRLGKGWNRINIWEDIGVKEWMEIIANIQIQGQVPGTAILQQFVAPIEYFRNDEDIIRWKRQRLYEERRIAEGKSACLAVIGSSGFEDHLDEHFPLHADYPTNCTYCEYEIVCHGGVKAYLHDPMSSQRFMERKANHGAELKLIQPAPEPER